MNTIHISDGADSVNGAIPASAHSGALAFDTLAQLAGNRSPADVPCPLCGPAKRDRHKRDKRVLRIWRTEPDFTTYSCARCREHGWASDRSAKWVDRREIERRMRDAQHHQAIETAQRVGKARWLWTQSRLATATIVESYLRSRAIEVLPLTVRYLPPRGEHAPAMICAFGMPGEPPSAVHLTKLKPDGSGKAPPDDQGRGKIMVGVTGDAPIALVPPNDLGGLAIAEGVETVLSAAQEGFGAWAAGAAGRLPKLAGFIAPLSYIEAVTILAEDDDAGRGGADGLASELARLRPDIEVRMS